MTAQPQPQSRKQPKRYRAKLDYSKGQGLFVIAETYPSLFAVILEIIQNALDATASKIWVAIDLEKRTISVEDNGDGVSISQFSKALMSVNQSIKTTGKLGKFGRGLISPLGKCRKFTFTSRVPGHQYNEWVFNSEKIREQHDDVYIPGVLRDELTAPGKQRLLWNSRMLLEGITEDRGFGAIDLDTLYDSILTKFNRVLRRQKTFIMVGFRTADGKGQTRTIRADQPTGKPLDEVVVETKDAGNVYFRLYLADNQPGGRKGSIILGEEGDDYRFDFASFALHNDGLISAEAITALRSGCFTGDITAVKTKLSPTRKMFEKNNAFLDFCVAVEDWWKSIGKKLYREIENSRRDERYETLGRKSIDRIAELIKSNPALAHLMQVVKSATFGSQGKGHFPTPDGDQKVETPTKATDGKKNEPTGEHAGKGQKESRGEHEGHTPFDVQSPDGTLRRKVRNNSTGLTYTFYATGLNKIWEFDPKTATLNFNVRHPLWEMCDDKDRQILRLMDFLAIQALTLYAQPDSFTNQAQRDVLDATVEPYVYLLING